MAGNIIPAIATTNAIIAGIAVMKSFAVFRGESSTTKRVSWEPGVCVWGKRKGSTFSTDTPATLLPLFIRRFICEQLHDNPNFCILKIHPHRILFVEYAVLQVLG